MPLPSCTRRLTLLALPALLAACQRPPVAFNGIDLTGASYARGFELTDPQGQVRRLSDFKGKVVVVFFGFTQCPDVCPTTMGELRAIKEQLGRNADDLVTVFISVDPERDTPEVLRDYEKNFGPGVVALRGTAEQTKAVAREFKVVFQKVEGEGAHYTVDHTAASFLFDRQGAVRVYSRYGTAPAALKADLETLLGL
jgi:protein SCO1/2